MTRIVEKPINCECGNKFTIPIYHSVNVTVDPELKEKIFKDEINFGICNKCGKGYKVTIPLLYHDMDLKLMVWVLPETWKNREDAESIRQYYRNQLEKPLGFMPKIVSQGYVYSVVFGIRELKEKLEKFEVLWKKRKK